LLESLSNNKNKAFRIGITGPPGAGKSSIVNHLIKFFIKDKKKIAVLLVDPTSPFTHGAVLGDRIRLETFHDNPNIFIRSLASRKSKGGLSENISEISDFLEYVGYDIILYETVGIGQVEIDVFEEVDSVALVLVPESGDDIQMMKAGVLEIADIFIINKSDRHESEKLYNSLKSMLSISEKNKKDNCWLTPIIKTVAIKNEGIIEVFEALITHKNHLSLKAKNKYRIRYKNKVIKLLTDYLSNNFWTKERNDILEKEVKKSCKSQMNPYLLVKKIISHG